MLRTDADDTQPYLSDPGKGYNNILDIKSSACQIARIVPQPHEKRAKENHQRGRSGNTRSIALCQKLRRRVSG
jgi:hypothetical protein